MFRMLSSTSHRATDKTGGRTTSYKLLPCFHLPVTLGGKTRYQRTFTIQQLQPLKRRSWVCNPVPHHNRIEMLAIHRVLPLIKEIAIYGKTTIPCILNVQFARLRKELSLPTSKQTMPKCVSILMPLT